MTQKLLGFAAPGILYARSGELMVSWVVPVGLIFGRDIEFCPTFYILHVCNLVHEIYSYPSFVLINS